MMTGWRIFCYGVEVRGGTIMRLQSFSRWTYATMIFALIIGMAVAQANAESSTQPMAQCGGSDLLAKLKAEDPATYASWATAAAKVPNGEAVLWRIEGNGLSEPSWLFGTIHVTDPRILDLPPPMRAAFAEARTVALEVKGLENRWLSYFNNLLARPYEFLPAGQTWEQHLTEAEMKLMEVELQQYGYDIKDFKTYQPWSAMLNALSYPACETWRVYGGMNYLDAQLSVWANAAGKPVVGLETFSGSARMIAETSLKSQFTAMLALAKMTANPEDEQETGIRMYLNRQLHWYFVYEGSPIALSAEEIAALREFDHHTLDRRNLVMRDQALPLIKEGRAFIAVGAGHLPGDQGLVELFRKAGYEVTPVN